MNPHLKQAYTYGAQQALREAGITKLSNIDSVMAHLSEGMSPEDAVKAAYPEYSDEQIAAYIKEYGLGQQAKESAWKLPLAMGLGGAGVGALTADPDSRGAGAALGGVLGLAGGLGGLTAGAYSTRLGRATADLLRNTPSSMRGPMRSGLSRSLVKKIKAGDTEARRLLMGATAGGVAGTTLGGIAGGHLPGY